ncbi:transposase InsF for insertion sequence IS3A/B/C/D/E/fA [Salmonella enterica subsp. enterica serovar Agona str. 57.A.08]|nr:transposase InsF for insertion sequence IS3A/B/C/D/E/fA [Salmonella enterica subsp. enterica serovar Agona str. 57.A.08]
MKYVFIEKHPAAFRIKAMCRVLQVARSGWDGWAQRRHQINQRQQVRLVCDNVVRGAFSDANSAMVRHA